ncbi:MAG: hypothetical protein E5W81_04245 [Mesorhizobium sp.]|nr:MAG: hypothetical protein E5V36_00595 [Mesorhizobium sp.]TKB96435.1 MAG: hypothetical protein E5W81_04245 [Mesorhizobium sp.]
MGQLDVELYGTSGSGKTLLLTSIYKYLNRTDRTIDATEAIVVQYKRIEERKPLEPTGLSQEESLTIKDPRRTIRLISHPGEALLPNGALNPQPLMDRFRGSPERIFVAVLNPFLCDERAAWTAIRAMIATLQSSQGLGLDFEAALGMAFSALFHVEKRPLFDMSPQLATLVPANSKIAITYNHQIPELEDRFTWSGGDEDVIADISEELKRVVEEVVAKTKPQRDTVTAVLRTVPNGMVVLTHIDLEELMPAIDSADFDVIFDSLFANNPNRRISQQMLASMIKSEVRRSGMIPWKTLEGFPIRFMDYVTSLAAAGDEKASFKNVIWRRGFYAASLLSLVLCLVLITRDSMMGWALLMLTVISATGAMAIRTLEAREGSK